MRPIHERRLEKLKAPPKLFVGQLWVYARDDRPWQGSEPPGVAYVYAPDRKAERPIAHLSGFSLAASCRSRVMAAIARWPRRVPSAGHTSAGAYELAVAGPAPIASEALRHIGELYSTKARTRP